MASKYTARFLRAGVSVSIRRHPSDFPKLTRRQPYSSTAGLSAAVEPPILNPSSQSPLPEALQIPPNNDRSLSSRETAEGGDEGSARAIFKAAIAARGPRYNWTREEVAAIYHQPLLELTYQASTLHRRFHAPSEIQLCTLMNIKTGGCTEDCSYCAQSSRYASTTGLAAQPAASVASVLAAARTAKANGSTRFCMGAAWRDMRGRRAGLARIAEMVKGVNALGMESCVTLGMVDAEQAGVLKKAGLTAYNHNLDTSREFYPEIISTRSYDERLATLERVREAGIHVCSGGIVGLGEGDGDRVGLLHTIATLPRHPESFPVNALVPIKGTPLGERPPVEFTTVLRTVATARVVLPETIVRVAAGRKTMTEEQQMMCFMAGANAIFTGEKMLTTECNGWDEDKAMFGRWGLSPMKSFKKSMPEGEP